MGSSGASLKNKNKCHYHGHVICATTHWPSRHARRACHPHQIWLLRVPPHHHYRDDFVTYKEMAPKVLAAANKGKTLAAKEPWRLAYPTLVIPTNSLSMMSGTLLPSPKPLFLSPDSPKLVSRPLSTRTSSGCTVGTTAGWPPSFPLPVAAYIALFATSQVLWSIAQRCARVLER